MGCGGKYDTDEIEEGGFYLGLLADIFWRRWGRRIRHAVSHIVRCEGLKRAGRSSSAPVDFNAETQKAY